jgi:hypothetical protein
MSTSRLFTLGLIFSSLLLSGCGGGGGGNSSPPPSSTSSSSSSSISTPSSIASSSSSSASSNCQNQTGIQRLSCQHGHYSATTQYAGATQNWSHLVIAESGQVTFSGSADLSFTAADVASVTAEGASITITLNRTQAPTLFTFFSSADGQLRDVEYELDNKLIGVGLSVREALPNWIQNPNTLINNGIAGSINNQLFLLYHDPAIQSAYADERGLLFNGENETGDSWIIQIDTNNLEKNVDYLCRSDSGNISITLNINGKDNYSSKNGGQCRVQLTTIELRADNTIDYIDGIFVAELPSYDRNTTPWVIDGRFRFDVN